MKVFIGRIENVKQDYSYPLKEESKLISDNFVIPKPIWEYLLDYQRKGVEWLWNLHEKKVGGILSDEMGLGKTIQIISFISSLYFSEIKMKSSYSYKCSMIIVPATLLRMWLNEFYNWWPYLRIIILHRTGTFESSISKMLNESIKQPSIIITTYNTFIKMQKDLLKIEWDYVILDEGHKIKNPLTIINTLSSQVDTPHRIIISGTPIQNNLKELWSLFNFIYPGLLGDIMTFMNNVGHHITCSGYANASYLQIKTGYMCAKKLKKVIEPYLLRRKKKEVIHEIKLPNKSDFVIFCRLLEFQSKLYISTIEQKSFKEVLNGDLNKILSCLLKLRKICNHPCLYTLNDNNHWSRSSKMLVLDSLLHEWKDHHKVLIYSQSTKVLNIIQSFCNEKSYTYLRLDGSTPLSSRERIVNQFNSDNSIFIFLLTTKVGGVGLSLIGADRVVIYDPDWNPTTDTQAKERVWRIGQTRDVIIYRLLTAGTIEEKMYNRQVFKQYLANKVLENPGQSRAKLSFGDINELFTYDCDQNMPHTRIDKTITDTIADDNNIKPKKRKYKWRKNDSDDDNITPFILPNNKIVDRLEQIESINQVDKKLLQMEAKRIADEALSNFTQPTHQPIIPPELNNNSSSVGMDILKSFKTSSHLDSNILTKVNFSDTLNSNEPIDDSLIKYLISVGGEASSKQIVSFVRNNIKIDINQLEFKTILKKLCTQTYNEIIKMNTWSLKNEYYS